MKAITKKKYTKPQLKKFGKVKDLTLKSGSSSDVYGQGGFE